jgi:hypothetical protein
MRLRAILAAGIFLPALCAGGDASRCRLSKGLYESVTTGAKTLVPTGPAYSPFLSELADAVTHKDQPALQSCCDEASGDRAGGLLCQLATYLNSGRTDSKLFLESFPSSRKDTAMLWNLDAIAGAPGRSLFPPAGPSHRLVDELFLLVLDEREQAIAKYFNLSSHATGDIAKHMDGQIRLLLRESPAVVVNQWLTLRRYRTKLKELVRELQASVPAAEMQKVTRAARTLCAADNPDCPEILSLYAGK